MKNCTFQPNIEKLKNFGENKFDLNSLVSKLFSEKLNKKREKLEDASNPNASLESIEIKEDKKESQAFTFKPAFCEL